MVGMIMSYRADSVEASSSKKKKEVDPRIPVAKLRQSLGHNFVVKFHCNHCYVVIPVQDKDVAGIVGHVLASYDEVYISVEKCRLCSGSGFVGAEFRPIPPSVS